MATLLSPTPASRPTSAGYKVDISRGERIGRVSSEWFSRPDDERFLSLTELHAAVQARAERATTRTVETREVRVEASRDNAERLALLVPGRDQPVTPTHWSFGQLASLVGAPAGYLRQLPASPRYSRHPHCISAAPRATMRPGPGGLWTGSALRVVVVLERRVFFCRNMTVTCRAS